MSNKLKLIKLAQKDQKVQIKKYSYKQVQSLKAKLQSQKNLFYRLHSFEEKPELFRKGL